MRAIRAAVPAAAILTACCAAPAVQTADGELIQVQPGLALNAERLAPGAEPPPAEAEPTRMGASMAASTVFLALILAVAALPPCVALSRRMRGRG